MNNSIPHEPPLPSPTANMTMTWFVVSMDGVSKSGGLGGQPPPPFANRMLPSMRKQNDPRVFPYCKLGGDMIFLPQACMGRVGCAAPTACKQNDLHNLPLLQTWR